MQKHFIPSNHPIPWELLTHGSDICLLHYYLRIHLFRNKKGPGVVIRPAVVPGIVTAPVSYWSIFSCPFQQSKKSSRKLTWPSFLPVSKMASNRSLLDSMNFITRLNKDLSSYELRRMPSHVLYHRVPCSLLIDNSSIESGLWFVFLLLARSKHPSRYMPVSVGNRGRYQGYQSKGSRNDRACIPLIARVYSVQVLHLLKYLVVWQTKYISNQISIL